jgi:hypothetical protein
MFETGTLSSNDCGWRRPFQPTLKHEDQLREQQMGDGKSGGASRSVNQGLEPACAKFLSPSRHLVGVGGCAVPCVVTSVWQSSLASGCLVPRCRMAVDTKSLMLEYRAPCIAERSSKLGRGTSIWTKKAIEASLHVCARVRRAAVARCC